MVISHTYKYVFVELPRTGSTAISRELCEHYAGVRILRKHSTYRDFLKVATPEEKNYFVFSGIRSPLDDAVSRYFKLKTNHRQRYTDPGKQKRRWSVVERIETRLFHYIEATDIDFATFFMKFYTVPYNNWATLDHKKFDFVIRFENLQEDFDTALRMIGIQPKRPLPVVNKTGQRESRFRSYYTPQTIKRAKRVFGPFMKQWGYAFPPEWDATTVPWWNQLEFHAVNLFRHFYWRHLRFRI